MRARERGGKIYLQEERGDVVSCLASSIRLHFEGENLLDSFLQQDPHCNSTKKLMPLDIDVCLGILGHILKGSHSASAYLRNSILESEIAFDTILSALLSANSVVERMMNGLIVSLFIRHNSSVICLLISKILG